jgi:hypothetical protein
LDGIVVGFPLGVPSSHPHTSHFQFGGPPENGRIALHSAQEMLMLTHEF